ncbi:TPA: hypothetical protein ACPOL4_001958 [Haemophilus influenzae]
MVAKIRASESGVGSLFDGNIAFYFCWGFLGAKGDVTPFKNYVLFGYNTFLNARIGTLNLFNFYITSSSV